ncbi:MAG: porin family protein [Acidobacteria bacterium]|nr:porin family protein [Acidobacteriota bacterium]
MDVRRFGVAALIIAATVGVASAQDGGHGGFYVGGLIGTVDHQSSVTDVDYDWFGGTISQQEQGVTFGLTAGYNWNPGSTLFGVEFDWASTDPSTELRLYESINYEQEMNYLATLRFRGGLVVERTLVYFTAGLSYGDFDGQWIEDGDSADSWDDLGDSKTGFVYGGGFERFSQSGKWSFKLEGLWASFSDYDVDNSLEYTFNVEHEAFSIRFGVNYHI